MSSKIIATKVYNRHLLIHLENDVIEHVRVLNNEHTYSIGTIALGRVVKMLPATGACFVDIGDKENYYVKIPHSLNDVIFSDGAKHKTIHCEDQILIQISTEAIKTKAPSATTQFSLSGRYIVIEKGKGISISKKITEGDRKSLVLPDCINDISKLYHVIVRTEALSASNPDIIGEEIIELKNQADSILRKVATAKDRSILYEGDVPIISIVNSWMRYNPDEVVTDISDDYAILCNKVPIDIRLYSDELLPLVKLYKLESLIDNTLSKRVYLKSGAFLVVEQGETLTSIDVNSAHVISGDKQDIAFKVNCEAAIEIGHILRSRNISGMILIDFINLKDSKSENKLINLIKEVIKDDPIRTSYIDMTGLGLIELTRQKTYKSFIEQWKKDTNIQE